MVERFKDTGHPVFKSVSALSRGILKKTEWPRHHTLQWDASNTELLFRIIHSVNQLSIHGAVSNWCEQFGLTEAEKEQERPLGRKEPVTRGVLSSVNSQEVKISVSFFKTCIWKQFAEKHSGLRMTVRDNSINKGMRRHNFRASGCIWYELRNQT